MSRFLLIAPGFPPSVGGIERYLYVRCQDANDQATVLAPGVLGSRKQDKSSPFRVYRYPRFLHHWFGLRQLEQFFWTFLLVPCLYCQYRFQWIECGQALPMGLVALLVKLVTDIPYTVWTHGDDVLRPAKLIITNWLLRLVLTNAKTVCANSQSGTPS